MELSKAIRTAYFTALNGNVTYNGNDVPLFDAYAIPDGVTYPYILLSSQTSNQLRIKRCRRLLPRRARAVRVGKMGELLRGGELK